MSDEVLERLPPKLAAQLEVLPPKVLEVSQGSCVATSPLGVAGGLECRIKGVVERLQRATFTNGKDLDAVIELYLDYVKRIVGALRTAEAAIELETLDDVAASISTSSAEASCATRKRKAHTPALLPDPE